MNNLVQRTESERGMRLTVAIPFRQSEVVMRGHVVYKAKLIAEQ